MTRRTFLWVAVVSWVSVGAASALTSLFSHLGWGGGWTFYTPYSTAPTLGERLVNVALYVNMTLFPLAAVSTAVYLVMLDRAVRRGTVSRGFEVPAAAAPDA